MGRHEPSRKQIVLESAIDALGEDAFETLGPMEAAQPPKSCLNKKFKHPPACATQSPIPGNLAPNPASIMVSLNEECPRWVPGSVVKWAVWSASFKNKEDANFAAKHLQLAAKKWSEAKVGVTFEWVKNHDDATFVLVYAESNDGTLAKAFFPNHNPLDYVYVYNMAFSEEYKENMWSIFIHELGHALGLRHEFAIEKEGLGAVQLGPRNDLSVMNYRAEPPQLQQSDIDSTKAFYALTGKPPRVKKTPIKDYTPM